MERARFLKTLQIKLFDYCDYFFSGEIVHDARAGSVFIFLMIIYERTCTPICDIFITITAIQLFHYVSVRR